MHRIAHGIDGPVRDLHEAALRHSAEREPRLLFRRLPFDHLADEQTGQFLAPGSAEDEVVA